MDKTRKLKTAGAIIDFIFAATMLTLLVLFTVFAVNTMHYYNSADNTETSGFALVLLNVILYGGLYLAGILFVLTAVYVAFAVVDVVKCNKYGKNRHFASLAIFTAVLSAAPLAYCISTVKISLAYLAPIAILFACVVAEIALTCIAL